MRAVSTHLIVVVAFFHCVVLGNEATHPIDRDFAQALERFDDRSWYAPERFCFLCLTVPAERKTIYAYGFSAKDGQPHEIFSVNMKGTEVRRKCNSIDKRALGQLFSPFVYKNLCEKLTTEDPFPQQLGGVGFLIEILVGGKSHRFYRQNLFGEQRTEMDPNFEEAAMLGAEQAVMATASYVLGRVSRDLDAAEGKNSVHSPQKIDNKPEP